MLARADPRTQLWVAVGARPSQSAGQAGEETLLAALVLGITIGFLWAPCTGPVLGLIRTGAALKGREFRDRLAAAYAAGAATSLALLVGGRVFAAMKKSIGAGEWIRRGLAAAVLVAVASIALGKCRRYYSGQSDFRSASAKLPRPRLRGQRS